MLERWKVRMFERFTAGSESPGGNKCSSNRYNSFDPPQKQHFGDEFWKIGKSGFSKETRRARVVIWGMMPVESLPELRT